MMKTAEETAREAGDYLREQFGWELTVERKSDATLVTEHDRKAEKIIVDTLRGRFPDHGILAEEGSVGADSYTWRWIIDPLDGTHNFIRGVPLFGTIIGLMRKDEFVAGVIYMPVDGELYAAEKGGGAWKNGKQIRVSGARELIDCSLAVDSSIRFYPERMRGLIEELGPRVFNLRMYGSSARLLSHVAEGKLDGAIEFNDKPWDFAAGVTLIREAGGVMEPLDGRSLACEPMSYCAANAAIRAHLQDLISRRIERP